MRIEIKALHQRLGTTIVYVTHDQVEAMTMADRIVVMRDGHILQSGRPMEIYENPVDVFTARFIGTPSMNILAGRDEAAGACRPSPAGRCCWGSGRRTCWSARPRMAASSLTRDGDGGRAAGPRDAGPFPGRAATL